MTHNLPTRISLNQRNATIGVVGREKTDGLEYVFLKTFLKPDNTRRDVNFK
jgi:hypothetical protein